VTELDVSLDDIFKVHGHQHLAVDRRSRLTAGRS
jgi:hypothetical protein